MTETNNPTATSGVTDMAAVIGDPRKAGEEGPAGDQRKAGEDGPAGDPRPGGEASTSSDKPAAKKTTSKKS